MKNEARKGDSDSEWDSMSEMQPSPASDSTKSKIEVKPTTNHSVIDENPPYNFRSEVENRRERSLSPRPPGKKRKGRVYDPTLKLPIENSTKFQQELQNNPDQLESVENATKKLYGRDVLPALKRSQNVRSAEEVPETYESGRNNRGFVDDEEEDEEKMEPTKKWKSNLNYDKRPIKKETKKISRNKRNEIPDSEECSTLLQETFSAPSGRPFKTSLRSIDGFIQKAFFIFALPFSCFFLFLHHLIKFILQDILSPLLLDSLFLVSTYFLEPLLGRICRPMLHSVVICFASLSEVMEQLFRPIVDVVRACRCVEVNLNRKHLDTHEV